jgi:hypothetical protein
MRIVLAIRIAMVYTWQASGECQNDFVVESVRKELSRIAANGGVGSPGHRDELVLPSQLGVKHEHATSR